MCLIWRLGEAWVTTANAKGGATKKVKYLCLAHFPSSNAIEVLEQIVLLIKS